MKEAHRHIVSIFLALATISVLGLQTDWANLDAVNYFHWGIITALFVFTSTFGIRIAGGEVSLQPMVNLTGLYVLGIVPAGWAISVGSVLYGMARHAFPKRTRWPREQGTLALIGTTSANVTMLTTTILLSGWVYTDLGGMFPLDALPNAKITLALIGSSASYLAANYFIASLFFLMRGKAHLKHYLNNFFNILAYEVPPVSFAPLSAQIFTRLGLIQFGIFSLTLAVIAILIQRQALNERNLRQRLLELDSLKIIGETLSASLDITELAQSIYMVVARLMPARNFFLALYDRETQVVSFPLAYEHNQKAEWRPRAMGNGLSEYVLKTCKPLLIKRDMRARMAELGVDSIGRQALSWLGVPIVAGEEALGVIAVQSYPQPDQLPQEYDESHLEILKTIAAQASMAIRNARLYAQTDKSLARRLQELDSILSTTSEGLLLVDHDFNVLEANRAAAGFLDVPLVSLKGANILGSGGKDTSPLLEKMAFQPNDLEDIMDDLHQTRVAINQEIILLGAGQERPVERTLAPVFDQEQNISGWLFVFRDLTEERKLTQLREDMTHMLVHDLRAPIVTIQSGLDMVEAYLHQGDTEDMLEMVTIAKRGADHMLELINELLNISKLEVGDLQIDAQEIDLAQMYQDTIEHFNLIAKQIDIQFKVAFDPALPTLHADRELLKRVIHNLIDNALKFSPDKGKISVWAKPDPQDSKFILFGVADNGPGVPKEETETIFFKYTSGHEEHARRKGTGLGLYFTKLAVEAHGGSVWVESNHKKGSTFVIRLPLNPPQN